ncbi:hypothetical protein TNIN_15461 [Trichonephila inaurata madagascariensis]|uniref:Uncharacterized protein n=1 Tax=Trichonephila inaurata madagascariensis TaxID=2747483 RepID=A0A8X6XR16_9ARAC|nr:hypothetical protein TNIN_15461 [Trichonephila inaurata madagascariensis]
MSSFNTMQIFITHVDKGSSVIFGQMYAGSSENTTEVCSQASQIGMSCPSSKDSSITICCNLNDKSRLSTTGVPLGIQYWAARLN